MTECQRIFIPNFLKKAKISKKITIALRHIRKRAGQFYWWNLFSDRCLDSYLGAAMNGQWLPKNADSIFPPPLPVAKYCPGAQILFRNLIPYLHPTAFIFSARWCKLGLKNIFVLLVAFKSQIWIPASKLSKGWHWYPWSTLIFWISGWDIQIRVNIQGDTFPTKRIWNR